MSERGRIIGFGSAAVVVVAGVTAGLLVGGSTGTVLASALVTLGLGAVVLLVFLEIGLSEDRDRAQEEDQRREEAARRAKPQPQPRPARRPRRPL